MLAPASAVAAGLGLNEVRLAMFEQQSIAAAWTVYGRLLEYRSDRDQKNETLASFKFIYNNVINFPINVFFDLFYMFVRHDEKLICKILYSKQSLGAPCFHKGLFTQVHF